MPATIDTHIRANGCSRTLYGAQRRLKPATTVHGIRIVYALLDNPRQGNQPELKFDFVRVSYLGGRFG